MLRDPKLAPNGSGDRGKDAAPQAEGYPLPASIKTTEEAEEKEAKDESAPTQTLATDFERSNSDSPDLFT